VFFGWKDNRRSGIVLAMCHTQTLQYVHLQAQWPKEGRLSPSRTLPQEYGTPHTSTAQYE